MQLVHVNDNPHLTSLANSEVLAVITLTVWPFNRKNKQKRSFTRQTFGTIKLVNDV